ncbi:MAG: amino acid-binding protein [Methanosarcinales archaeon Met12]|nr:MAG: amino acid-binding protein [Methanosarcinales archaeon Met12]
MRVTMDLELKDIPGQLVLALRPISELGGNIVSVVHHRERKNPRGLIPVQIAFEIDETRVDTLVNRLKNDGVVVAQIGRERLRERAVVILVGHIVHSDISDTIAQVDGTGYAEVKDLAMSMPGIDQYSSARLIIRAMGKKELSDAIELLRNIAHEKGLLLIERVKTEVL